MCFNDFIKITGVKNMQVHHVSNQNFGMALKCSPSLSQIQVGIALKHSCRKSVKANKILKQLSQNKALTELSFVRSGNKSKLKAVVGDKVFIENWFNSPYRVLKKALKASKEQSSIELIANVIKTLSKDMV